jgi:6-phosphogluconolactonase (cycloisomerase 2 family)
LKHIGSSPSTLPHGTRNLTGHAAAELLLSSNGKYLLAGNRYWEEPRRNGSIAIFSVHDNDEHPVRPSSFLNDTHGVEARSMALDASGKWLAIAHQGDDSGRGVNLAIFAFDQTTGDLSKRPAAVYEGSQQGLQSVVWVEPRTIPKAKVADLKLSSACNVQ